MPPSKTEAANSRNPRYVPPIGDHRPIEKLPPEILAYIFELGMLGEEYEEGWEVEEDDGDEDYEDIDDSEFDDASIEDLDDDGTQAGDVSMPGSYNGCSHWTSRDTDEESSLLLPYQVRMSHACRKWRQIALNNPTLWTTLDFTEPRPFLRSQEWLERSKQAPLDLLIDISDQEPGEDTSDSSDLNLDNVRTEAENNASRDLAMILDLVIPHVARWRTFELNTWMHDQIFYALTRLAQCSNAPLLRSLRLYCDEDFDEMQHDDDDVPVRYEERFLLFGGYVENLQELELSAVHLDWKMFIPPSERDHLGASRVPLQATSLTDIDLSYHSRLVRPSFQDFVNLIRCSPNLTTLKLVGSGPSVFTQDTSTQTLLLPKLRHLVLGDFGSQYAISIFRLLRAPNLRNLDLDFDEDDDYTSLIDELAPVVASSDSSALPPLTSIPAHCRPELVNLTDLKLAGLPCEERCAHATYLACRNVRQLQLNMNFLPDSFFSLLMLSDAELYSRMERPADGLYSGTPGGSRYPNQPGPCKLILLRHLESLTVSGLTGEEYVALVKRRKALGAPIVELNIDENDDVSHSDAMWLKRNVKTVDFVDFSDEVEEVDFSGDDEDLPFSPGFFHNENVDWLYNE